MFNQPFAVRLAAVVVLGFAAFLIAIAVLPVFAYVMEM